MTSPRLMTALLLVAVAATTQFSDESPATGEPARLPNNWMTNGLWDDGRAEFAVYDTRWRRYGRLNDGRLCIVVVKEPWQADKDVKAESAGGSDFNVLKMNVIRDVDTGVYTYEQMASVFVRRDTGELRKMATASLEACGQTTTMLKKGRLDTRSYWGDEGDRSQAWPDGVLPEDALPMYLRGLISGPIPESIRLFPSLMAGNLPMLEAAEFKLSRKSGIPVETKAGKFQTVAFTLSYGRESLTYNLNADFPHSLIRYRNSNGTEYSLAKLERMPYWNRNAPADRAWWPERLR